MVVRDREWRNETKKKEKKGGKRKKVEPVIIYIDHYRWLCWSQRK